MRPATSCQKTYELLKTAIETRRLLPGSQLPPEPDLAREYQVARNTLRKALSMLETENLLVRHIGKGTFIREEKELPTVYFMLPHANYMTRNDSSSCFIRECLHGSMLAASDYHCRLETIVMSRDDNNKNLEIQQLERLNSSSMVFIPGSWFYPVFSLLHSMGCRVALWHNHSYHANEYRDEIADWIQLISDRRNALATLTARLLATGSQKVALVTPFLWEKQHPLWAGYCDTMTKNGLTPCGMELTPFKAVGKISDFYEREKFDALIINTGNFPQVYTDDSCNSFLGIPENVRTVLLDYRENCCRFGQYYGAQNFNGLPPGYDAVKFLLTSRGSLTQLYEPSLLLHGGS